MFGTLKFLKIRGFRDRLYLFLQVKLDTRGYEELYKFQTYIWIISKDNETLIL
jgi:hypothetical protein